MIYGKQMKERQKRIEGTVTIKSTLILKRIRKMNHVLRLKPVYYKSFKSNI